MGKIISLTILSIISVSLISCNEGKNQTSMEKPANHPKISGAELVKEKGCLNCHNGKKARTFEEMAKTAPPDKQKFEQMVKGKCMTDQLTIDEFDSFADFITKQLKNK
jgi:hypothetical protein